MSFGDTDLGSLLVQVMACCLATPNHNLKSWTNVDLLTKVVSAIHLRAISQEVPMNLICNVFWDCAFKVDTKSPKGEWFQKWQYYIMHVILSKVFARAACPCVPSMERYIFSNTLTDTGCCRPSKYKTGALRKYLEKWSTSIVADITTICRKIKIKNQWKKM